MFKRHQETSKQAIKVGLLFLLIWKGMKLFQIFTEITVSNRVEENGDHGHGLEEEPLNLSDMWVPCICFQKA
jgi:hypothetical protein